MKERVFAYAKATSLTAEDLSAVAGGKGIIKDIFKDIHFNWPSFSFTGNSPGDGELEVKVQF